MFDYILICLCLSLAGVTGLQFLYLAYLDRLDKDQKNRIRTLERHCQKLSQQLETAESEIETLKSEDAEPKQKEAVVDEDGDEVWADVLE